ncbi:hypothetical protein [uncultured Arcticibacterium sp.]|uniref:hypothetical protein n=1 Tax=uncultured Arcticibacterium sp. TaxID=2173042 RepID=UPI0030F587C9
MNKIVRLFSVLALASTVAFVGCKGDTGDQGPIGPAGPTGQNGVDGQNGTDGTDGVDGVDGVDGNANVKSFMATVAVADWANVERSGIGTSTTSTWGGAAVSSDLITADKAVFVALISGEEKISLPVSLSKEIDGSVESLLFSYKTGQVSLYYKSQSQLFGGSTSYAPEMDIQVKVTVVEEVEVAALKAAGISLDDYDAVMNYLGRSVQLPTQQ